MAEEAQAVQTAEATPESSAAADINAKVAQLDSAQANAAPEAQATAQDDAPASNAASAEPSADHAAPTLSDRQRQAAMHLGYTTEEMATLTPAETGRLERLSADKRRLESKIGREKQVGKPAVEADSEQGEVAKQPEAVTKKAVNNLRITPEDDFDTIAAKHNALADALTEARQEIAGFKASTQQQTQAQVRKESDAFFTGLDQDAYSEVFGTGPTAALPKDSVERQFRNRLLSAAADLMDIRQARGEETTLEQCANAMLHDVAPEAFRKAIENPVRQRLDKRFKASVTRPGAVERTADTRSEDERTADRIDKAVAGLPTV